MARLGLFHCRCRAYTLKNPRATSTGGGAPILSLLVYGYWLLYKVQVGRWTKPRYLPVVPEKTFSSPGPRDVLRLLRGAG